MWTSRLAVHPLLTGLSPKLQGAMPLDAEPNRITAFHDLITAVPYAGDGGVRQGVLVTENLSRCNCAPQADLVFYCEAQQCCRLFKM